MGGTKFDFEEESDTNSTSKLAPIAASVDTIKSTAPNKTKTSSEKMKSSKSETSLSKKAKSQLLGTDNRRALFMRQKSFDVDSDSTDIDVSLTPSTEAQNQKKVKDCRKGFDSLFYL